MSNESPSHTHNIIFQAAPNRCILDGLDTNLYVGLITGHIFCIPIKSVLHDSNKLITESEYKSFVGHKYFLNANNKLNSIVINRAYFTLGKI